MGDGSKCRSSVSNTIGSLWVVARLAEVRELCEKRIKKVNATLSTFNIVLLFKDRRSGYSILMS